MENVEKNPSFSVTYIAVYDFRLRVSYSEGATTEYYVTNSSSIVDGLTRYTLTHATKGPPPWRPKTSPTRGAGGTAVFFSVRSLVCAATAFC
jgi:hypothetical protein